jgi:hypothetical protein
MRSGRLAGNVPSTLGGSRLALPLGLEALSAIDVRVYARSGEALPAIMSGDAPPSHRAALRSAGYQTGHKLRVEVDNRSA